MIMEKLIILDYSDTSVHIYNVDSDTEIDESYIGNLGFHCSNCHWMVSKGLNLYSHKGILK